MTMEEQYSRTELIIGKAALEKLSRCRVAVFGLGGVGGYAAEALARSGIGALDLIDSDSAAVSNLNRQLIALKSTVGRLKTDLFESRIMDIDPAIRVRKYPIFYMPERRGEIPFESFDYIVDAIDTVSAKLDIIETARKLGIPVISAMGCGNKLDPEKLVLCDINKTEGDPLARVMRRELRLRGIKKLNVVCSRELPIKHAADEDCADPGSPVNTETDNTYPGAPSGTEKNNAAAGSPGSAKTGSKPSRRPPGSMIFVPASAGLMIASKVVRDLIQSDKQ